MGKARRKLLLILAAAHLGVVVRGALRAYLGEGWGSPAIAEYAAISGAENFYTFFAPGVDTDLRPVFEVTEPSGRVITDVLRRPENAEIDLRVGDLYAVFWWRDEEVHRALLAAWASTMFARHPGAVEVAIRVEACDLPSMAEHRAGARPAWRLVERAVFSPGDVDAERGR